MSLKDLLQYSKNINILYAEDDEVTQELYYAIFQDLFLSVDVASDGVEALEKYSAKKYEIVISDVSMPNMNGIELCQKIIEKNMHQSIIVVTAHTESEYIDEFTKLGIDTFLPKPIHHAELINILFNVSKHVADLKE